MVNLYQLDHVKRTKEQHNIQPARKSTYCKIFHQNIKSIPVQGEDHLDLLQAIHCVVVLASTAVGRAGQVFNARFGTGHRAAPFTEWRPLHVHKTKARGAEELVENGGERKLRRLGDDVGVDRVDGGSRHNLAEEFGAIGGSSGNDGVLVGKFLESHGDGSLEDAADVRPKVFRVGTDGRGPTGMADDVDAPIEGVEVGSV